MSINVNDKNLGHATAYAYYKAGGGTMTEAEFTEFMADFGTASQTAVEAAQAALASKNAAQTAATTATNKASEATTAAQTATTKAGEADQSASQAQTYAQTASTKASEASQSASTATEKATEATTAATSANTAKVDAVTAKTAAETAQGKAEDAQAAAEAVAESIPSDYSQLSEDVSELKSEFTALTSDGVVPSAEQILTDKGITDSVPYHYRKTGGNGADRLYDQIVGGSLAVNQLFNTSNYAQSTTSNGITFTNNGDGTVTANGTATARANFSLGTITVISGHVYIYGTPDTNNAERWIGNSTYGTQNGMKYMYKMTVNGLVWMNCMVASGATLNNYVFKPQCIDLTAMFGSTIADYIYQLEQTTAGAGVAFFKSLFPNDYYPYNAGELKSVEGLVSHDMTGFNQFNKSVATLGKRCKLDGTLETQSKYAVTDYIRVVENTSYYCKDIVGANAYISAIFFNENKEVTGTANVSGSGTASGIITIPNGTAYLRCNMLVTNIDTICINLSDPTKNGIYEPYVKHSYPLDSALTLRGIPNLVDGKIKWDGDVYSPSGKVKRRYNVQTVNGTETITKGTTDTFQFFEVSGPVNTNSWETGIISNLFPPNTSGTTGRRIQYNSSKLLRIVLPTDDSIQTVDALKTFLSNNPLQVIYPLATPTTESADPYQHLQQCDPNGTEEYVSTGIVPIGHNSFYPENLRAKVEQLPWNFASLIAPTESTFTATRNYVTGDLFIVNNVLYKATSNIANDGTITPNTNCTATTLAEIISALA